MIRILRFRVQLPVNLRFQCRHCLRRQELLAQHRQHRLFQGFLFDCARPAAHMAMVIAAVPNHIGTAATAQQAGQEVIVAPQTLALGPRAFSLTQDAVGFVVGDQGFMSIAHDQPLVRVPEALPARVLSVDDFVMPISQSMARVNQHTFFEVLERVVGHLHVQGMHQCLAQLSPRPPL